MTHLVNLELKNDNLKGFNAKWDEITIQLREEPPEGWLETLYRKQLETSEQFTQILALYKNDISLKRAEPSYTKLKEMVEYYLADIQNQTHKKNLSANTSGLAAFLANMKKNNKPDCRNWFNKGRCARKDNDCPYDHDPEKTRHRKEG